MTRRVALRACPYCGSLDTHPALLFGGPLPWVDHNDGGYECRNCGKTAVPLDFDSWMSLRRSDEAWSRRCRRMKETSATYPFCQSTFVLFRLPVVDLPIGQIAEVVEAEWLNGHIEPTGQRVKFQQYWSAVGGPQYSAKEIALWDLSGIRDAHPNFEVLKRLVRSRYRVWLDLGMRDIQDVFDSFAMDVSRAIMGTLTSPDLELFEEAFELSDHVIPCIHYDGKYYGRPARLGQKDWRPWWPSLWT